MRTCTKDGCAKPHKARGLCGTHYNQTLPNRHAKREVACAWCGRRALKDARKQLRYTNEYCSVECRDNGIRKTWPTCTLPADHWARWYGKTSKWSRPTQRNTGECAWCERPNPRGRTAAYCSPECKVKAKRVRRIGREHNAPGEYTYGQLVRLWMTFDKGCAYCGERVPLSDIQAEHVVPLSRGGANHIGNILPSCLPCNADKRDLLLIEWEADRKRRGLTPVLTSWNAEDPRYAHLNRTDVQLAA